MLAMNGRASRPDSIEPTSDRPLAQLPQFER
jgi:hypothetical protein